MPLLCHAQRPRDDGEDAQLCALQSNHGILYLCETNSDDRRPYFPWIVWLEVIRVILRHRRCLLKRKTREAVKRCFGLVAMPLGARGHIPYPNRPFARARCDEPAGRLGPYNLRNNAQAADTSALHSPSLQAQIPPPTQCPKRRQSQRSISSRNLQGGPLWKRRQSRPLSQASRNGHLKRSSSAFGWTGQQLFRWSSREILVRIMDEMIALQTARGPNHQQGGLP